MAIPPPDGLSLGRSRGRTATRRRPVPYVAAIEVLLLHRSLPFPAVHAALDAADRIGSVDAGLVAIEARRITDRRGPTGSVVDRPALRRFDRDAPLLTVYDGLLAEGGR